MKLLSLRPRFAAILLLIGLLACAVVGVLRIREEHHMNRTELAMDYGDFLDLANSYGYDPRNFLIALRRSGVTSLALSEELGANVVTDGNGYVVDGATLREQARIAMPTDPLLAGLVHSGRVDTHAIYLLVNRASTFARYKAMLGLHFEAKSVMVLRNRAPYLIEVKTELPYFAQLGLGIPARQLALAHELGFLVIPRFQNDERYGPAQIDALFASLGDPHMISTVIFFGLRNQVIGYPDHIDAMANLFDTHAYNFGTIEVYDKSQIQKGSTHLAQLIPGRTVRVQAIAKTELDKLRYNEILARYELGVRERNVRVVYLRPLGHRDGEKTLERTNLDFVHDLATSLQHEGFRLGRATPIGAYLGDNALLVGIASLAVPSIAILLLAWLGFYRPQYAAWAYGLWFALFAGGMVTHHLLLARSILALLGALLFATATFAVLSGAFNAVPKATFGAQVRASLGWTLLATGIALLGALVVVGILSTPMTMEEIIPFRGVKLVLGLPPLIALALYVFSGRFGNRQSVEDVALTPVRVVHLIMLAAVGVAGALLVMRSGNTSDIAPSGFELLVRRDLTELLSVRPRFKEFLVGVPLLMLLPAFLPTQRRAIGWLLALGLGVGIGDVIDTFSHLHTPVLISLFRVVNGLTIGVFIGILGIWILRRVFGSRTLT